MNGIWYKNTQTNIPYFENTTHLQQKLGYAYETNSHYVHLFGRNIRFNAISVGLTVIEKKMGH